MEVCTTAVLLGLIGIPINYMVLKLLLSPQANDNVVVICIIFANVTVSAVLRNLLTSLNIFKQVRIFVLMNLFSLTTGVGFAILLTLTFEASIENWFIGLLVGELLALPIIYYRFKNSAKLSDDLIERIYLPISTVPLLKYCGPMVLTNLLIWSQICISRHNRFETWQ